jgi:predicted regulator of Ras-like GTPase activity (Roadblock/LC7/MglB family)
LPRARALLEELHRALATAAEERATVTFEVESGRAKATLFLRHGELVDAETDWKRGPTALLEVLRWPVSAWRQRPGCAREGIGVPLAELIEGVRISSIPGAPAPIESLEEVVERIEVEIPDLIAVEIVERGSGFSLASGGAHIGADPAHVAATFGEVLKAVSRAVPLLVTGGETEDVLISAEHAAIVLRPLGTEHALILVAGRGGNPGLARAIAKKYARAAARLLERLSEVP